MWQASIILTEANLTQAIPYFCMRCRSRLFDINRDILALWMGENYPARQIPKDMGWLQHKCRGCQYVYNVYFQ